LKEREDLGDGGRKVSEVGKRRKTRRTELEKGWRIGAGADFSVDLILDIKYIHFLLLR